MQDEPMRPTPRRHHSRDACREHEDGSSVVEYVGLGAIAAMLVSGIAAALDSGAGERVGAALVRRLLEVIGSG
jgi:hypothetical protein